MSVSFESKQSILHKIDATVQRDDHKSLGKEVLEASPYKGSITNYVDKLLPIIYHLPKGFSYPPLVDICERNPLKENLHAVDISISTYLTCLAP